MLKLLIDLTCFTKLQCERLGGGMNKLAEASAQLAELNGKLVVSKKAVNEKSISCDALLRTIAEGTREAEEKKVQHDKAIQLGCSLIFYRLSPCAGLPVLTVGGRIIRAAVKGAFVVHFASCLPRTGCSLSLVWHLT